MAWHETLTTYKHGHGRRGKQTKEYRAWCSIKGRCLYPSATSFERYGAKGITIDAEYAGSFEAWLNEIGPAPSPKHEVDRIDNSKGYIKGNMRWATRRQNLRNYAQNRIETIDGITAPLVELCEKLNLPYGGMLNHLHALGRSAQDAADFLRKNKGRKGRPPKYATL